jgi:hypothetical protein
MSRGSAAEGSRQAAGGRGSPSGERKEWPAGSDLLTAGEATVLASMITGNGIQPGDVAAFALVVVTCDGNMIISHSPSPGVPDFLSHAANLLSAEGTGWRSRPEGRGGGACGDERNGSAARAIRSRDDRA